MDRQTDRPKTKYPRISYYGGGGVSKRRKYIYVLLPCACQKLASCRRDMEYTVMLLDNISYPSPNKTIRGFTTGCSPYTLRPDNEIFPM